MAFGMLSGLQPSEEEKKKRREQFEGNKAKLGFGANAPQGSLLGAGKLGQQVQQQGRVIPAPNPAQAQMQASVQAGRQARTQVLAQVETDKLAQAKKQNEVRAQAQSLVRLPVKEQAQAVEQLKAQAPAPQRSSYQPSKAGDVAIGAVQASTYLPQVMFAGTNALTGGKLSDLAKSGGIHPQNFRDALERFKTPQQVEAGVPQADKPAPNLGMMNNPNTSKSVNVDDGMIAKEARASQGIQEDDASVLNPIYAEGVTRGNPDNKKFGLSVDNNAAVAQPVAPAMGGGNSGFGFGVMAAPRKAYGEDSRRAAIRMDIKPYKGMNGRLTTGQIALNDAIRKGDDEKYENQRYGVQIGMAQTLAQEGMQQAGANSRAQLTERGATSRAELNERAAGERQANQLGFDSEKFQQTLAQDNRRLNMQQSNDQITNYGVKKLNEFREAWLDAKSPEEKTAIEQQMAILNAGSKGDSKPIVINQTGQTATGDQMGTTVDNPAMLYDPNTKEFINLPTAERAPNDPPMQALQQSGKYTKEQKGEIYDIYMNGGDISSYLN